MVAGGHGSPSQSGCQDRVDVFDPATGTWSTTFVWYGCCTYLLAVGDQLFAGNGTTLDRPIDPELSGWYGLTPNLRGSFAESTAAATDDSLFVFGAGSAERYQLALDIR